MANNNQAHLFKARSTREASLDSRESSMDRNTGDDSDSNPSDSGPFSQIKNLLLQPPSQLSPIAQQLAQSNMALEAIQNTRMALAHFATSTINNSANNPQAMQELAVLQGTLFSLQQQQAIQVQLIQQLQAQLSIKSKDSISPSNAPSTNDSPPASHDVSPPKPPKIPCVPPPLGPGPTSEGNGNSVSSSIISSLMDKIKASQSEQPERTSASSLVSSSGAVTSSSPGADARNRPITPPMTASSIASSVIQHTDIPPPDEPNTLEMLQRTANQVLDNASQGLLTSRLIDDCKNPEGKDPYYKHRCRYCGKVFGSDSALQIHIRSHTGERPFKCNICGNRFTTKGNLKVHFQRHSARFPHVKMNPHPVPEHLDKFHPPLLAQLGELKDYPSPPTGPPNPFSQPPLAPPVPPFRVHGPPHALDLHKPLSLVSSFKSNDHESHPENLSVMDDQRSPDFRAKLENKDSPVESVMDVENSPYPPQFDTPRICEDKPPEEPEEPERPPPAESEPPATTTTTTNSPSSSSFPTERQNHDPVPPEPSFHERTPCSDQVSISDHEASVDYGPLDIRVKADRELKELNEQEQMMREMKESEVSDTRSTSSLDQPTDLRKRPEFKPLGMATAPFSVPRFPLNFPFMTGVPPSFPIPLGPPMQRPIPPGVDPAKDPNIYTSLLPKPGSSDTSWEALIEVQKTSETMKLEQLVNNIEHKLTDPNQCIICHRVLSCKSALQMHYRTHTGERPFKCKICSRAFTTKGNLKTHMGVHRAKPPMRMLHQCPVCHKKYTNALVLQQHIRLHTGEPTDLTPEQIAAAEVREFPPQLQTPTSIPQLLPSGFPLPPHPLHVLPPLPLSLRHQLSPEAFRRLDSAEEDRICADEERYLRPFSTSSHSSSTGSAEQRTAEDLTTRSREDSLNGALSPRVSVSPTPSDYSDLGDRSQEGMMMGAEGYGSPPDRHILTSASPSVSMCSPDGNPTSVSLPLDLAAARHQPPLFSPFGLFPPPLTSASITPSSSTMPSLSPLYLPTLPGQGNTTCTLCFKTFACQSALEIHIRSHTKERPFKCTICDRGFSTKEGGRCFCSFLPTAARPPLVRPSAEAPCQPLPPPPILIPGLRSAPFFGNMKQHMLTHKIRDSFDTAKSEGSCGGGGGGGGGGGVGSSEAVSSSESDAPAPGPPPSVAAEEDKLQDSGIKREREGELTLPVPKRQSGSPGDADPSDQTTSPCAGLTDPLAPPDVMPRSLSTSPTASVAPHSLPSPSESVSLPATTHIPLPATSHPLATTSAHLPLAPSPHLPLPSSAHLPLQLPPNLPIPIPPPPPPTPTPKPTLSPPPTHSLSPQSTV
ncbi:homeotic protein spalt-major-like isoform X3 [Oratosquilla oratoria]